MSLINQIDRQPAEDERIYQQIKHLIEQSKAQVVSQVNQALVLNREDYREVGQFQGAIAFAHPCSRA
jgi:predicted oxidoreductase (fatty acid repression mutant protein)